MQRVWVFTEVARATTWRGFLEQTILFLYEYSVFIQDFYATMDSLRKAQLFGLHIKRSDMKCRHKRTAGTTVKRKKISVSALRW